MLKGKILKSAVAIGIVILGIFAYSLVQDNSAGDDNSLKDSCVKNEDCVTDGCCHAAECVNKNYAPDCEGQYCTMSCEPNTLDCGQGSCECIENKCRAVLNG